MKLFHRVIPLQVRFRIASNLQCLENYLLMMKIIVSFLLWFWVLNNISAQDFLPILRSDAKWTILHQIDKGFQNPRDTITEHYRLGSDTIIDELTWKKIFFSTDTVFSWDDPDLQFGGVIREENGRVYYAGDRIKYHTDGDLIYDFNLQVGEAFWEGMNDIAEPMHLIVHSIDTVFLQDNLPRRRYHLRFTRLVTGFTDMFDTSTWVEGLGDILKGLLHSYLPPDIGTDIRRVDELICYTVDNNIIFNSSDFERCFFERITTRTTDRFLGGIKIFPNPARHYINISSDNPLALTQIWVSNQWGQLVFQDFNVLVTKDYQIESIDWPPGVYLVSLEIQGATNTFKVIHH